MTDYAGVSEEALLNSVVQDFRRRGYNVVVEPGASDLPDFLRSFRPDAVALGPDDNVVIEVKARNAPGSPAHEYAMSEAIGHQQGWRLHLVVAGSPEEQRALGASPIPPEEVHRRLPSVTRLFSEGEQAPALLLLWSLLEAAAVDWLRRSGIDRRGPLNAVSLLKDLVSFGALEQADYEQLKGAARLRNAAAHGYLDIVIDEATLNRLLDLTKRLSNTDDQTTVAEPL